MLNIKILETFACPTCSSLILFIDTDEDDQDNECVTLLAWHKKEDIEYLQKEKFTFSGMSGSDILHRSFIADFSETSATDFVNNFKF